MSRRKQSNPRQFRLSTAPGAAVEFENGCSDMEDGEIPKEKEPCVDEETQFPVPPGNVHVKKEDTSEKGAGTENQDETITAEKEHEHRSLTTPEAWDGPDELELISDGTETVLCCAQVVPSGTRWGPFTGKIEQVSEGNDLSLVVTGGPRWLEKVTWVSADDSKNNCVVYSKGGHVWCSTTRSLMEGEALAVYLQDFSSSPSSTQPFNQQSSNSSNINNIFPCKACGIWFKSDRNLQAHLMYYCSGNQKESEMTEIPQCNTNPPATHTSTGPQCNSSLMGPAVLDLNLPVPSASAVKFEIPPTGSRLKCTICAHPAETPALLQLHILTHLSQTGLRCSGCHFTFQTPRDLQEHREVHRHGVEEKESGGLGNLESLHGVEQESKERGQKGEANPGVKSEPSSPRLASSPIPNHVGAAFPRTPFLPQGPQASEILAKMSELVHRRLRQGGSLVSPVPYGMLAQKGATCFECNIAFGNLENYLVHKKHYCSSRWLNSVKPLDLLSGGGLAEILKARRTFGLKDPNPRAQKMPLFDSAGKASEELSVPSPKAEEGLEDDSKTSPRAEDQPDLSPTTCQACKITFSRQETFMVHKQIYCASRHDPPAKRATGKSSNQKPFRTRKRRKVQDPIPAPVGCFPPMVGAPYVTPNAAENLKDQFHQQYHIIQGLVPKQPGPSLTVEAPIDLSKKCGVEFGQISSLMDYHECAVCKISFNKVEDYLSHKQNFCPLEVKMERSGSPRSEETSLKDEITTPNVDQESQPRKKIRPDDQIWPYYETDPSDYATGVFFSQSVSRRSPNEGAEVQKEQQMPLRHFTVAPETGLRSHLTPPEGATEIQVASKTEMSSSKRSVNGPMKYCRPCDIQFNNLSNFITHKKFYCATHVK